MEFPLRLKGFCKVLKEKVCIGSASVFSAIRWRHANSMKLYYNYFCRPLDVFPLKLELQTHAPGPMTIRKIIEDAGLTLETFKVCFAAILRSHGGYACIRVAGTLL